MKKHSIVSTLGATNQVNTWLGRYRANIIRDSMIGWYRGDNVVLNGSDVSTWPDNSPKGYDLVQATPALQPAYVTGVLNNQPVLRFNAAEWMRVIYGSTFTAPFTIFIVAKCTATSLAILIDSVSNYSYIYILPSVTRLAIGDFVKELRDNTSTISTNFITSKIIANGTSSAIYEDGVLKVTGNAGTISYNGLTLGAFNALSSFFKGDIAEVIIYNELLSAAFTVTVENYFHKKYFG